MAKGKPGRVKPSTGDRKARPSPLSQGPDPEALGGWGGALPPPRGRRRGASGGRRMAPGGLGGGRRFAPGRTCRSPPLAARPADLETRQADRAPAHQHPESGILPPAHRLGRCAERIGRRGRVGRRSRQSKRRGGEECDDRPSNGRHGLSPFARDIILAHPSPDAKEEARGPATPMGLAIRWNKPLGRKPPTPIFHPATQCALNKEPGVA